MRWTSDDQRSLPDGTSTWGGGFRAEVSTLKTQNLVASALNSFTIYAGGV